MKAPSGGASFSTRAGARAAAISATLAAMMALAIKAAPACAISALGSMRLRRARSRVTAVEETRAPTTEARIAPRASPSTRAAT